MAGIHDVPAWISDDPAQAVPQVQAWVAALRGTGQVAFAIPIDEPHTPEQRTKVRQLADAVHAAGASPDVFRLAVTDTPHPEYGDAIDLFITVKAKRSDTFPRWTYNGAPPGAGAMVLDAETPGLRTWGWIAWRWKIPVWYIWDALYWHDRHNRKGAQLPGRALDLADPISFDDGEDHGNLDGVLALPAACRPCASQRCAAASSIASCSTSPPHATARPPSGSPRSWCRAPWATRPRTSRGPPTRRRGRPRGASC